MPPSGPSALFPLVAGRRWPRRSRSSSCRSFRSPSPTRASQRPTRPASTSARRLHRCAQAGWQRVSGSANLLSQSAIDGMPVCHGSRRPDRTWPLEHGPAEPRSRWESRSSCSRSASAPVSPRSDHAFPSRSSRLYSRRRGFSTSASSATSASPGHGHLPSPSGSSGSRFISPSHSAAGSSSIGACGWPERSPAPARTA